MFPGIGDHWRVRSWQDREHQAVDAVSGRCQQVLFKPGMKIEIFLSLTFYFLCFLDALLFCTKTFRFFNRSLSKSLRLRRSLKVSETPRRFVTTTRLGSASTWRSSSTEGSSLAPT